MAKTPRKLSLVRFDPAQVPRASRRRYPFRVGASYIFLGEIPNMPGHCVVVDHPSGKIYSGYHKDHFVELGKDET